MSYYNQPQNDGWTTGDDCQKCGAEADFTQYLCKACEDERVAQCRNDGLDPYE